MPPTLSRRNLLIGVSLALSSRPLLAAGDKGVQDRLRDLESSVGGRLGVAALDMETDRRVDYRSSSLFPLCSTFKLLLVGAVLAKIDRGGETLEREIPLTEACAGALIDSDNSCANLLLASIGGPGALTLFARSLGDRTTRLDRIEPFLNEATPGDARDTTSPAAMLNDLGVLVLQDALGKGSRELLTDWLVKSHTGADKLRAGLSADWKVGDKSGSGGHGTSNDVAIVWPPGRKPLLISAYLTESGAPPAERNQALAEIARLVVAELVSGS